MNKWTTNIDSSRGRRGDFKWRTWCLRECGPRFIYQPIIHHMKEHGKFLPFMWLTDSWERLPVQSGEILSFGATKIGSFLLSFWSLHRSFSWTNIIQITKTSYQMERRDGWHVVPSPGLCVCVCSSSVWLCVCSDWALSAGTEDVQSWVEVAPLGPRAPSQHRVLVQAFLPPLLPADRQPSRSHKADEDQASSFACHSRLLPWRIYELTVWTAWLWTVPWLFC